MNLNPGDYVVHPAYGVGVLNTVEEMEFAEKGPQLFYRVEFDKSTVWIPVQVQQIGGIRPITQKRELDQYCAILKSPAIHLDDNFRIRQVELEKRLQQSSFRSLCEVVRDLNARRREKPLNNYDFSLYNKTRNSLIQEWAVASGSTIEEATQKIDAYMAESKRESSPLSQLESSSS